MNNTFCYVTTGLSQPNGQCLAGVCDVVTQNCIEPAAECQYGPDGGRDCYPNGTAGEGEECSPTIFCRKGTLCLLDQALNDGGLGTGCARFCRTDADCVSSRQCSTQLQVPGSVEKALLCRPIPLTCNPLTQNCSLGTDSCYLVASTTGCGPTGTAAEGAACATVNACARGYACANGGTGAACHKVCNTDAGLPQCNSGTCYPSPAVGGVGVCF